MRRARKSQFRFNDGGDGGFTVIEMLIAFTILAIVAGSIFQIFNVSARNNKLAAEYDNANNLAIMAVELFKADPTLMDGAMFDTGSGFNDARSWRSNDGGRFLKYYDAKWAELVIPFADGIVGDVAPPTGAAYLLEVILGEIVETAPGADYMTGAVTIPLDSSDNYRIVVNESRSTGEIEIDFNGIPKDVMQNRITEIIPVNINYQDIGVVPKHVAVVNKTERTVNLNVFGVPVGTVASPDAGLSDAPNGAGGGVDGRADDETASDADMTGAAMNSDYGRYISVSPVEGALSVMFFDELTQDRLTKTIAVSVRSVADTVGESGISEESTLAYIEATKYMS